MIPFSAPAAFTELTAGLGLIMWECCAPGTVVPGAAGAVLALAGGWALVQHGITPYAALLLPAAAVLGWLAIFKSNSRLLDGVFVAVFCVACYLSIASPGRYWPAVSLPLSTILAVSSLLLIRISVAARRNKTAV